MGIGEYTMANQETALANPSGRTTGNSPNTYMFVPHKSPNRFFLSGIWDPTSCDSFCVSLYSSEDPRNIKQTFRNSLLTAFNSSYLRGIPWKKGHETMWLKSWLIMPN